MGDAFRRDHVIQRRSCPHRLRKRMRGSRTFQLRTTIALMALGGLGLACGSEHPATPGALNSGGADGMGGSVASSAGNSSSGSGPVTTIDGLSLPTGDTPTARLHRLTQSELEHSLQDLLGDGVPLSKGDPDSVVNGFASIGASVVSTSPSGVGLYEDAVRAATQYVFAEPARVAQLGCSAQSATDTCVNETISRIGRRAFRRPLTDAEKQRYTGLVVSIAGRQGGSAAEGLRHALNAILQSPSFLYRVELGVPSAADGGRSKYTDYELASRLAATLWDSVPDDALLDAAASGKLGTAEGLKAEASRLLADGKAKRALSTFADQLFGMKHLEEATKDPAVFPLWTDSLKASMRRELELRVEDMVFTRKGDFLSLFDERSTFVNAELAKFYGLPAVAGDGFMPATFPADSPRAGLLGAGAVLAGHALPQRTSPTQRGKFVAESLLCRVVPPPPPNVPPLPPMAGPDATLRERLEMHRAAPQCSACHAIMDPMGFGMENFDSIGLPRTMDGTKPVDATGTLTGAGLDGSSFNGLAELGAALRKQPVLGPCLVTQLYAEAQGRQAIEADRETINQLSQVFRGSQNRLDQLLLELVASESFRFVEPSKG